MHADIYPFGIEEHLLKSPLHDMAYDGRKMSLEEMDLKVMHGGKNHGKRFHSMYSTMPCEDQRGWECCSLGRFLGGRHVRGIGGWSVFDWDRILEDHVYSEPVKGGRSVQRVYVYPWV